MGQQGRGGETGDAATDHNHVLDLFHRGMLAAELDQRGCVISWNGPW